MTYPRILSERDTIEAAHAGKSLARYGDGELRLAIGGHSVSQRPDKRLQAELMDILAGRFGPDVLPCIPNFVPEMPRQRYFREYSQDKFTRLYTRDEPYGSVFVSRPECAPWIDTSEYWERVTDFWRGQRVQYVSGDDRLLRVVNRTVSDVIIHRLPKQNAYSVIDEVTRVCLGYRDRRVIIALGAAGTALAARLGQQGVHALDLGHMGMFMENPGAYAITPDELTSPEYRAEIQQLHREKHWGKGGHSWAEKIRDFVEVLGGVDCVLDYGCGSGTLKPALAALGIKCNEYDPGIPGKDVPPKLADLVVSTDVFEHIEPEKVDAVLRHTFLLARKGGFFAIAKQPAKAILPVSGRNAHLTCQEDAWWVKRLKAAGWTDVRVVETAWKKCLVLCRK